MTDSAYFWTAGALLLMEAAIVIFLVRKERR